MAEVIKFPTVEKSPSPETSVESLDEVNNSNVLEFVKTPDYASNVIACLSEGNPYIVTGGEVVIEICGKKYKGTVTEILQKDKNNNVTKIAYTIPFLNSGDPLKFGEAEFKYIIEKHD